MNGSCHRQPAPRRPGVRAASGERVRGLEGVEDPARAVTLVDEPLHEQERQGEGHEQRPELVARRARLGRRLGHGRAERRDARAVAGTDVGFLGREQVDREEQRLVLSADGAGAR